MGLRIDSVLVELLLFYSLVGRQICLAGRLHLSSESEEVSVPRLSAINLHDGDRQRSLLGIQNQGSGWTDHDNPCDFKDSVAHRGYCLAIQHMKQFDFLQKSGEVELGHMWSCMENALKSREVGTLDIDEDEKTALLLASVMKYAHHVKPEWKDGGLNASRWEGNVTWMTLRATEGLDDLRQRNIVRLVQRMHKFWRQYSHHETNASPQLGGYVRPWILWPYVCNRLSAFGESSVSRVASFTVGFGRPIAYCTPLWNSGTPKVKTEAAVLEAAKANDRRARYVQHRKYGVWSASMIDHFYDWLLHLADFHFRIGNRYLEAEVLLNRGYLLDFCLEFGQDMHPLTIHTLKDLLLKAGHSVEEIEDRLMKCNYNFETGASVRSVKAKDIGDLSADLTLQTAYVLAPLLGLLILALVIGALGEERYKGLINRSSVTICVGGASGLLLRAFSPYLGLDFANLRERVLSDKLSEETLSPWFFLLLFPYLFFPSGYTARVRYLIQHWEWLILGTLGPLVSVMVISVLVDLGQLQWRGLFYSSQTLDRFPIYRRELYIAACCVSIVDPTPMLFEMGRRKVPRFVSVPILWESLIAPSMVVYLISEASYPSTVVQNFSPWTFWHLTRPRTHLVADVFLSIGCGFVVGLVMSLFMRMRWLRKRPNWEAAVMIVMPLLAHAIVQSMGLWAILADIPSGLVMGHYLREQLSQEGRVLADTAIGQVTVLVCTIYYFGCAAYFSLTWTGAGFVWGVLLFLCSVVGRGFTLAICLPLCRILRTLQGRCPEQHGVEQESVRSGELVPASPVEWRDYMGLALLQFVGQSRGGIWFTIFFTRQISPNKDMLVDAVATVFLLSHMTFGLVSQVAYEASGLPCGAEAERVDEEHEIEEVILSRRWMILKPILDHLQDVFEDVEDSGLNGCSFNRPMLGGGVGDVRNSVA